MTLAARTSTGEMVAALAGYGGRKRLANLPPLPLTADVKERTHGVRLITELAVRPEWQGQGIGGKLLETAELQFRNSGATIILIFVQDHPATDHDERVLYRSRGYDETAIVPSGAAAGIHLPEAAGAFTVLGSSRPGQFFYKLL